MELPYLHRAHVEQLSREVAAALEKSGFDALAVHSGAPLKRTDADDQYWPLRPTPHFQHWLPLEGPRRCGGCSATPTGASSSCISPSSAPLARTTRRPRTRTSLRWETTPPPCIT